jgi:putative GTP pyrophosphokinase
VEEQVLRQRYDGLVAHYERLGSNVRDALVQLMAEARIDTLAVTYRVKEFASFRDKVARKQYGDAFRQTGDLCGVRIIAFYPSDTDRIAELIRDEFDVAESVDKTTELGFDRFGYRSSHYVASLKREWLGAPSFRGLDGLLVEIQVRTILMHAWANLSHALSYKSPEQVPELFQRRIFQLSALFELADQEFDRLRAEKLTYQKEAQVVVAAGLSEFDAAQPLNIDTLQAFLDFHFPDREVSAVQTEDLLEEMIRVGATLSGLQRGSSLLETSLAEMESETFEGSAHKGSRWAQVGIARHILDVTHDPYWETRRDRLPPYMERPVVRKRLELASRDANSTDLGGLTSR